MRHHRRSPQRQRPQSPEDKAKVVKDRRDAALANLDSDTRRLLADWAKRFKESGELEPFARRVGQTASRLIVFLARVRDAGLARAMHEIETGKLRIDPIELRRAMGVTEIGGADADA